MGGCQIDARRRRNGRGVGGAGASSEFLGCAKAITEAIGEEDSGPHAYEDSKLIFDVVAGLFPKV